ncbi:MAG TPA: hypothetical protein VG939_16935, partial [Caulobacteraceae bacterium]|nr:hypothetical protein [Caulobacteraceae bacterium]
MGDDTAGDGMVRVEAALKGVRPAAGPFVVGVTGSVASGKSTFSAELARRIAGWSGAPPVEVVSTDGFLFPNTVLEARGELNRKGYPETYDVAAMRAALAQARRGPVLIPGYSHVIYDIDPARARTVEGAGAL